jgi:flagellar basal-body rod protein FlgC
VSTLGDAARASASALTAERARIEVAVSNMANAESTRGANGQPYRRRDVVLASEPVESFDAVLGRSDAIGVKVAGVLEDQTPFKRRYDPAHPDADAGGFVALPNVDVPEQMVDMMTASRAYQANLAAIGLINDMIRHALDLGK